MWPRPPCDGAQFRYRRRFVHGNDTTRWRRRELIRSSLLLLSLLRFRRRPALLVVVVVVVIVVVVPLVICRGHGGGQTQCPHRHEIPNFLSSRCSLFVVVHSLLLLLFVVVVRCCYTCSCCSSLSIGWIGLLFLLWWWWFVFQWCCMGIAYRSLTFSSKKNLGRNMYHVKYRIKICIKFWDMLQLISTRLPYILYYETCIILCTDS